MWVVLWALLKWLWINTLINYTELSTQSSIVINLCACTVGVNYSSLFVCLLLLRFDCWLLLSKRGTNRISTIQGFWFMDFPKSRLFKVKVSFSFPIDTDIYDALSVSGKWHGNGDLWRSVAQLTSPQYGWCTIGSSIWFQLLGISD